jgi:hypothetical protein
VSARPPGILGEVTRGVGIGIIKVEIFRWSWTKSRYRSRDLSGEVEKPGGLSGTQILANRTTSSHCGWKDGRLVGMHSPIVASAGARLSWKAVWMVETNYKPRSSFIPGNYHNDRVCTSKMEYICTLELRLQSRIEPNRSPTRLWWSFS